MYPRWQVTHTCICTYSFIKQYFFITNLLERSALVLLHRLYIDQTDYINMKQHYVWIHILCDLVPPTVSECHEYKPKVTVTLCQMYSTLHAKYKPNKTHNNVLSWKLLSWSKLVHSDILCHAAVKVYKSTELWEQHQSQPDPETITPGWSMLPFTL